MTVQQRSIVCRYIDLSEVDTVIRIVQDGVMTVKAREEAAVNPEVQLGDEVRAWIARRHLSQRRVALELGMTPTSLNHRINGKRSFDLTELLKISALLDITLGQLLGEELLNEKNPHLLGADEGSGDRGSAD